MAPDPYDGLFGPGDWGVMANNGVLHIAETIGGLPRSHALCGAVGTSFLVSAPLRAKACGRCAELARDGAGGVPR